MMEEVFETGANGLEVADPATEQQEQTQTQQDEQVQETSVETAEVADPQKPVQDPETNAKFAELRRRIEAETRDKMIRELSNGQFSSWAEYQAAVEAQQRAQEAEEMGLPAEFYERFATLEAKLNAVEQEKTMIQQDAALQKEPFYSEWRDEVHSLAGQLGVDLETAYTLMVRQKLPEIIAQTTKQGEQKTLQSVIDRNKKQIESTADAGHVSKIDVNSLSDKDLDDLAERALRGERIVL